MSTVFKDQYESSPLQGANATYVEWLYEQFLAEPGSVPAEWRQYFSTLAADGGEVAHGPIVQAVARRVRHRNAEPGAASAGGDAPAIEKQAAVSRLIQVYSLRGHQIADLDPLGLWERPAPAVLSFDFLGLDEADLTREFSTGGLAGTGHARMKLQDILSLLKRIYCGKLAAEFAHISRARERLWLREQFELSRVDAAFPAAEQTDVLAALTRAEGIERYLNTRFVGQKRFSLEGSETLIPLLDDLIQRAGEHGRAGDRDRHGPSRSSERARQRARQVAVGSILRVRGSVRPHEPERLGRREVSQGLLGRRPHGGRQRSHRAGVQPVAPRDRESRGRRFRARPPGSARPIRSARPSCPC